ADHKLDFINIEQVKITGIFHHFYTNVSLAALSIHAKLIKRNIKNSGIKKQYFGAVHAGDYGCVEGISRIAFSLATFITIYYFDPVRCSQLQHALPYAHLAIGGAGFTGHCQSDKTNPNVYHFGLKFREWRRDFFFPDVIRHRKSLDTGYRPWL
ncbi:MAG: hypothetical protein ACKOVA_20285, partial [Novosphingobium sp.]